MLVFAVPLLAAQSVTRRGLAHPVVCHALLRAETLISFNSADRSARVSIRDALYQLMQAHEITTDAVFAGVDGFATPNFLGTHAPWNVLAHLRDLDADLYNENPKLNHVSFELRGRQEVGAYLEALEASARDIQAEVLKQKRAKYPRVRLATLVESLIPVGLALGVFSQSGMPLPALLQNGALMLAFSAALEAAVRLNPIKQRQFTLSKQLKFIKRVLQGEAHGDKRIALVTGSLLAGDFTDDVVATAEASFPSLITNLDKSFALTNSAKPPVNPQHIFYDSLFFMDQTEPVWVITYRAYHEPPHSKLRFTDDEDEAEPTPFSFGTRALQPIPIPVRDRPRN